MAVFDRTGSNPTSSTLRIHRLLLVGAFLLLSGLVLLAGDVGINYLGNHNNPPPPDPQIGPSNLIPGLAPGQVEYGSSCGDGACNGSETCANCTTDCCPEFKNGSDCPERGCGDGVCDPNCGESSASCRADCGDFCGDTVCGPSEVDNCQQDCPVSVTCGDGICSAFEDNITCPEECQPKATATFTPRPPTETPLPTNTPVPQPTSVPQSSSDDPDQPTNTPTASPTPSPTPEEEAEAPEVETGCRIVERDDMPGDIVSSFEAVAEAGYSAPYYMICDEPPEVVAIPEDPNVTLTDDELERLTLWDCFSDTCVRFGVTDIQNFQYIAVAALIEGVPTCAQGCAFAIAPESESVAEETDGGIPFIPIMLILLGLLLISIFLFTRSRRDDEDEEYFDDEIGGY